MTPAEVMTRLAHIGAAARLHEDGGLRLWIPAGVVLDGALLAAVRSQKSALLDVLRERARSTTAACMGCGRFHFIEPRLCYWCVQAAAQTDDQKAVA